MKIAVEVIQDEKPTKAGYYLVLLKHRETGRTFCETINWNPMFHEWDIVTTVYDIIGWVYDPFELKEENILS